MGWSEERERKRERERDTPPTEHWVSNPSELCDSYSGLTKKLEVWGLSSTTNNTSPRLLTNYSILMESDEGVFTPYE